MSNEKTFLNFYWSLRKFLFENFPATPTYYNPVTAPSVTEDKTILLYFQDDYLARLAESSPRIICVAKNDPESIKITELVSAVVEKFVSPSTGLKMINLLEYETETVIGQIRVRNVRARVTLPYSEGFIQKAVDMDMSYIVEQRHLFA